MLIKYMIKRKYYGFHINLSRMSIYEGIKKVKDAGGNLIQIFMPSDSKINKKELLKIKDTLIKNKMKIVIHSSYIHNLAREWDEYSWWIINLELEIQYAHDIGSFGIVIHTGNQLDLSKWQAWNNMYTSLLYIHKKTLKYKDVKIFIETSSGEGTETLYKIEDLSKFYRKFSITKDKKIKDRFKICVDTCHIFAAGYDISSKAIIKLYLEAFDELIGIKNIGLVHFSDSKNGVGSKIDRHASIGNGYIGLDNLRYLFKFFLSRYIPTVLETPGDINRKKELKMLLNK